LHSLLIFQLIGFTFFENTTNDEQKAFRLWLTLRFKETMKDALTVLGLPAPDRM